MLPRGDLVLMGDLNARTQRLPDLLLNENNDHIPVPPPDLYETDTAETDFRNNIDNGSNSYGAKFLNLCKTLPLRILNGRFLGDLLGNYTCFTPRLWSCFPSSSKTSQIFPCLRPLSPAV